MASKLMLTYAMFKPTTSICPLTCQAITNRIIESDFLIVKRKRLIMDRAMASEFYAEHKGKVFYETLMSYMMSGPAVAHILAHKDAVAQWRQLMGPTRVYKGWFENTDCIRSMYGLTDTRNATHGADAESTAKREIGILFPDFNFDQWMTAEEPKYRQGKSVYDSASGVHRLQ